MASHPVEFPYRYLTWRLIEFQMELLKGALRLFPGDLHRAIIFILIARMSCRNWTEGNSIAAPACATAFSVNALAASLSRPFETVRRHVIGMIDDGVCQRAVEHELEPVAVLVVFQRDEADVERRLDHRAKLIVGNGC